MQFKDNAVKRQTLPAVNSYLPFDLKKKKKLKINISFSLIITCPLYTSHHFNPISDLSELDLLFLLFEEGGRDSCDVLLGTQQQGPEVLHELTRILPIQETGQVNLHHLTIWIL